MRKLILTACMLLSAHALSAQYGYWQQKADYRMLIDFDHEHHRFTGKQTITYTNNSPDTIYKVYYHLYFNAFQPGSSMDVRSRTISDPDRRVGERIFQLKPDETGYHHIQSLKQNGIILVTSVQGTILQARLDKPLLPGAKTELSMEFESQVPVQIRRSGRNSQDGVDYSMTQWYPKLCEYDYEGWHTDPYIGREFYGVWGNFDVSITIDKKFLIGGTGYLTNPQQVGHGYEEKGKPLSLPAGNKLTWKFSAPDVHDFAWAADADYLHDQVQVPGGPVLHFIYQPDKSLENWKKLPPYMIAMFNLMNEKFGKYPYKQFTFIQGGDGGMEYPMATLVTSRGSLNGLIGVCVHEAIHNWYYGVLATNESRYPWMDEGFTTYAQDIVMNEILGLGSDNPHEGSYSDYIGMIAGGEKEVLSTHADAYHQNSTYGTSAYSSGAVFLHQLSYVMGKQAFDKGMLRYFSEWKFRHPTPTDFIRVMEKTSGLDLKWYLQNFIYTLNEVDYAIASIVPDETGKTTIRLQRKGSFPMPLDLTVTLRNGKKERYYIPLDLMMGNREEGNPSVLSTWPWVYPEYSFQLSAAVEDISSVTIDESNRLCDIDRTNNTWPAKNGILLQGK